jgi:hypothetical protein
MDHDANKLFVGSDEPRTEPHERFCAEQVCREPSIRSSQDCELSDCETRVYVHHAPVVDQRVMSNRFVVVEDQEAIGPESASFYTCSAFHPLPQKDGISVQWWL